MAEPPNRIAQAFRSNWVLTRETLDELRLLARLYIIFITPRSGSTWLTEIAAMSGRLGTPQEWFNEAWVNGRELALGCTPPAALGATDINDYVRRVVGAFRSPSGVMGVQLSLSQTLMLRDMVEAPDELLTALPVFYLRRRNLVAQAISLYRSAESDFFHSYQSDPQNRARFDGLGYDPVRIAVWIEHLVEIEVRFESVYRTCGLRPRRFYYEDFRADGDLALRWLESGVGGAPARGAEPTPQGLVTRISDVRNARWERRFRTEQAHVLAAAMARRPPLLTDAEPIVPQASSPSAGRRAGAESAPQLDLEHAARPAAERRAIAPPAP